MSIQHVSLRQLKVFEAAASNRSFSKAAQLLHLTQPGVSMHIKVLETARLVRRTRQGREHTLELDPAPLREVARWASDVERFWSERLDRIEKFFEEKKKREKRRSGN